jgi:ABC-type glycerol-3-phosphate transport system substrate-binding protein
MSGSRLTRRTLLQSAATTALAAPFVHGAFAAGKLAVGFWDHWVPGANDTLTKLCREWADKEKVEISIDYITSQADKLNLTQAAEAQAKSGHDMLTSLAWAAAAQTENLEPVDDIMAPLIAQNGKISEGIEYVAKQGGHWIAVPACVGSPTLPSCARIDLFKEYLGVDLTKMYPPGAPANDELAGKWDWDFFLTVAEKCFKAGQGHLIGVGLGVTNDSVAWVDPVFRSHGAAMVDQEGNITVKSDATRQVLEWYKKFVPYIPKDAFAWDDSSNNKYLISGQGSLIFNPPSAWAVAVRDAPKVAEQLWTFPAPKGPRGGLKQRCRFLGNLEILAKQIGGKEPADLSLPALLGRADGGGESRLRHPALREAARFQDLGRGKPAKGHDLPLSAARRHGDGDPLQPGARADRQPDLCAGDRAQDDRQMHRRGPIDRSGDRLGGLRARGLQPGLAPEITG